MYAFKESNRRSIHDQIVNKGKKGEKETSTDLEMEFCSSGRCAARGAVEIC